MVSSDCHVRNARARATGLGMLPSETSLANEIWNLHLSASPPPSSPESTQPASGWDNLSQSITSQNGNVTTKIIQSRRCSCMHHVTDNYVLILQTPFITTSICARGPVMVFIMKHIIETTTEGNMFTSPSATSHSESDRRFWTCVKDNLSPKCEITPALHYKAELQTVSHIQT